MHKRRLIERLAQRASNLFLPVAMGIVVVGLILIVGVEIGRRKERAETPGKIEAATFLCTRYVVAIGKELDTEREKNRVLIDGVGPVDTSKRGERF